MTMLEPKEGIGLEEPGGEMRGRLRGTKRRRRKWPNKKSEQRR